MTLIITALAALIVTVLRFARPLLAVKYHLGALALMYCGATIMWVVDGFACLIEGEPFIELIDVATVADDALLGGSVVVLGLAVWGIILLVKHHPANKTAAHA